MRQSLAAHPAVRYRSVTRSGTNDFHGTMYESRNDVLMHVIGLSIRKD